MAEYTGPDNPPTGAVIVNWLDPDGKPANASRLHLDYETTGRVEVVHGGPFQKFNIQLDPKRKDS